MSRPKPYKLDTKALRFPEKYAGDINNIVIRSSWEKRMILWLDFCSSVVLWNSEEMVIPYISPLDNRPHRYFADFTAKMKLKDGTEKIFVIEIKPLKEMKPPRKSANKERLLTEVTTYMVNQAKWEAARKFCTARRPTRTAM